MPKTSSTSARSPKSGGPKRDGVPAKRDGRAGYSSNRGDYVPKREAGERTSSRDSDNRAAAPKREGYAPKAREGYAPKREGYAPKAREGYAPRSRDGQEPKRDGYKGHDFNPAGERPARAERSTRPDRVERDYSRDNEFKGARSKSSTGKTFDGDKVLDRLESDADVTSFNTFQEMGLPERLVQELAKMGAATPFPIQAATIPAAMEGRHVLGRGKTGSGKTIAFGVPLIAHMAAGGNAPRKPNKPRAIVLAPTRELAEQIDRTLSQLAKSVGFYTTTVYGGVPQRKQQIILNRGVDIVIATPGRLEDLIAQRIIDLSEVERVVVDEADHMCDLGFIEPVNRILSLTGKSQKLLFSATLDREVDALVKRFMPSPFVYEVPNETSETSDIEHRVLVLEPHDRSAVFHRLVQGADRSIVFVRTKQTAEALSQSLNEAGVPTARLHGDLNQAQRTKNLERFTKGSARVMIATDVAARGIHVDDVRLVIQLDLPEEYKTYLHRAGRTGRAGRSGTVVSLVPVGRTRKAEGLLERAERQATFTKVTPGDPMLEELAGPIAPPPSVTGLDFGDSRFESTNKAAVKTNLRAKHSPARVGEAKDRRYRSR